MATSVATATEVICGAPTETMEAPATPVYRLRKSFAAVHFDPVGKGRIVFLPEGAELLVVGPSRMSGCFEVAHEDRLYNVFTVDLLGPWSNALRSQQIKLGRASAALGACA